MAEGKKILIANRGEIARRIQSSCRVLGMTAVAIYSQEDRALAYVREADEACALEGETLAETYLNGAQIIALAQATSCHGLHPGYGFLSEDADFAAAVEAAGLVFIGPSSSTIAVMGDKIAARKKMQQLGVPLLPGHEASGADPKGFLAAAEAMGFPVLIKASSGGGGRAMAVVERAADFLQRFEAVLLESEKLFGNRLVYLEKYLARSKHLEVQVLSDQHQHHLHVFERDCSSQRRRQKVIEEAPAPSLTPAWRDKICNIATTIAKEMDYCGAGTVEFIQDLDQPENIYFLEMNTRIQVEHVVSEVITQMDLVAWQIRVAFGEALPFGQKDLRVKGHAIEARVYAEDPEAQFFPTSGTLSHCHCPALPQTRWDASYEAGDSISLLYDAMIGKLIVWDENRDLAIERLKQALMAMEIGGVVNNLHHLLQLIDSKAFREGSIATSDIESMDLNPKLDFATLDQGEQASLLAAHLFTKGGHSGTAPLAETTEGTTASPSPWQDPDLACFRLKP